MRGPGGTFILMGGLVGGLFGGTMGGLAFASPPTVQADTSASPNAAAATTASASVRVEWTSTRAADAPAPSDDATRRREQLGRLAFARLTIEAEEVPLRDVLRALRKALGINLMFFEERSAGGNLVRGLDGDALIELVLSDVDGYTVLDALVALAGPDASWQLNGSVVEFGLKSHLARDEARRTEVIEAGDLSHIAPDFASCDHGKSYNRLDGSEVLADLIRLVTTHCEPRAFEAAPERVHDAAPTGSASGPIRSNPNTAAWRNLDPRVGPVYVHGRWASIQSRDTQLVVTAPDFVLRRIVGYPSPLPPRLLPPSQRPIANPRVGARP